VFFDHSDLVSLEIQTEKLGRVNVAVQGEEIRWYIIHGSTPKEVRNSDLHRAPLFRLRVDTRS
jgi:hypothetical protein